jgi:hypothetical protein
VDGSSTGARAPSNWVLSLKAHDSQEPGDANGSGQVIGFDIAKSVFQVHGINAKGKVILRRQLKRRYVLPFLQNLPPCLVGMSGLMLHRTRHLFMR